MTRLAELDLEVDDFSEVAPPVAILEVEMDEEVDLLAKLLAELDLDKEDGNLLVLVVDVTE